MNIRNRFVYKRLLLENGDELSKALSYFLNLKGKENQAKRLFVEDLLEKKGTLYVKSALEGSNYELDLSDIPSKVRERLIESYRADNGLIEEQQDEDDLLEQMNEIF